MSKHLVLYGAVCVAILFALGGWLMLSVPSTTEISPTSIESSTVESHDLLTNAHLGLNFFVFQGGAKAEQAVRAISSAATATDLAALHAEAVRQLTNADVLWSTVEPREGVWNWTPTDAALNAIVNTSEPIVELFAMQYASPNAPWKRTGTFEKTMTPEAETYIRAVVGRYKDRVKYWEIGNEMDHWRAADPGEADRLKGKFSDVIDKMPTLLPADGYNPEAQGRFFAAVATIVREEDPDAVMVMPGMAAIADYQTDTWLPEFVAGAGVDAFDVVNYHDYGSWDGMQNRFDALKQTMKELGISNKPIWLTETGSTADRTLTQRTDYPNSTKTQAADVSRRLLVALSNGANLAIWHTYFSSPSLEETNPWRAYGLRDENGDHYPSYDAYQSLAESFPAESVENVSTNDDAYIMKITPIDGAVAYVVWGSGRWTVPEGLESESAGSEISLTSTPRLYR